jgi:hypothetical protein
MPLTDVEVTLLTQKEEAERLQYYKVFRALMIFCFVISFLTSWYRAFDGAPNAFSYLRFFVTTGILLFIVSFATYASYRFYHRTLQQDLKERTKTIETHRITKKVFVPANNAFYLYTTSRTTLSIEVSPEYFAALGEGDEVSLEFATHSRLYLGYF